MKKDCHTICLKKNCLKDRENLKVVVAQVLTIVVTPDVIYVHLTFYIFVKTILGRNYLVKTLVWYDQNVISILTGDIAYQKPQRLISKSQNRKRTLLHG